MNKIQKNKDENKASSPKTQKLGFFSYTKFSVKKQTFFAKRLSFLIKAGVPMLESIHVIRKQTKGGNEIKVFDKVIISVGENPEKQDFEARNLYFKEFKNRPIFITRLKAVKLCEDRNAGVSGWLASGGKS